MKKDKKLKICFAASSGGHLSELKKLSNLAEVYDSFLITERVQDLRTSFCDKTYYVKETNRREKFFAMNFIFLCLKELFVYLKERPDIIISTGALSAYPIMRIAKMFGKKIIFVESYARINDLSLTGKKVIRYADVFIVQWKELKEKYPDTVYVGSLF